MRNIAIVIVTIAIIFMALSAFGMAVSTLVTSNSNIYAEDWPVPTVIFSLILMLVLVRILSRIGTGEPGAARDDLRRIEQRLARLEARLNVAPPPPGKHRGSARDEEAELVQALHEHGSKMQERLENLETVLIDKSRH